MQWHFSTVGQPAGFCAKTLVFWSIAICGDQSLAVN
jgi:hypothetical protein